MSRPSHPSGPMHLARATDPAPEADAPLPAGARHALRTPVHAILGSAELLLETALDDEQREHAEAVLRSAHALRAIVDGFFEPVEPSIDPIDATEAANRPALRGRVLVVDDEPVNCRIAAGMLAPLGLEVDVAVGGAAGVEAVERSAYDLVVTDIRMPHVDGIALTRRIRAIDRRQRRTTAVIALTADASAADRRRCLDAGVDEYVAKPVHLQTLASAVARWLPSTDAERVVTSSGTMQRHERLERRREPAIDPTALNDLRALAVDLGVDALGEVFELYLADVPARVTQLADHLAAGDDDALARAAHSLCGSSGSVGARRLSELARRLERSDERDARAALIPQIERESARVVEALEAELASLRLRAAGSG